MRFSQRKGLRPVRSVLQVDSVDDETRSKLWNALHLFVWSNNYFQSDVGEKAFGDYSFALWHHFYKKPVDEVPDFFRFRYLIKEKFLKVEWAEFYDFLEFTLDYFEKDDLNEVVNSILETELAGYRFVGGMITDITDEQEVRMLEDALADDEFPLVVKHLDRALKLLSDRQHPDYRNSIKESISAVESLAKQITGKPSATLGEALKELGLDGTVHPALKDGWLKLYGYTSDGDGIRHGLMEEPNLSADDAKYFLLTCTSFINYLKTKIAQND